MAALLAPTTSSASSGTVTVAGSPVTFVLVTGSNNTTPSGVVIDIVMNCSNGTFTTIHRLTETDPAVVVTAMGSYSVRKSKTDIAVGVDFFAAPTNNTET